MGNAYGERGPEKWIDPYYCKIAGTTSRMGSVAMGGMGSKGGNETYVSDTVLSILSSYKVVTSTRMEKT